MALTYTYDGPTASKKDKFRFKIQDTGSNKIWHFADEEIIALLDDYEFDAAVLESVRRILFKYAPYRDERINNVSSFDSQIYANYSELYDTLLATVVATTAIPFCGGISKDGKKAISENYDAIAAWASKDEDDTEDIYNW